MKYTLSANQAAAYLAGFVDKLDIIDLLIFDAFKDFANSNRIKKKIEGQRVWFWIDYKSIIDEMPFVPIKTKDAVYRRMRKLAECQIIEFHPGNQKAAQSFFAWGNNYDALIFDQFSPQQTEILQKAGIPTDEKPAVDLRIENRRGTDEKPEGYGLKTGGVRMKNRRGTDEKPDYQYTNPLPTQKPDPLTNQNAGASAAPLPKEPPHVEAEKKEKAPPSGAAPPQQQDHTTAEPEPLQTSAPAAPPAVTQGDVIDHLTRRLNEITGRSFRLNNKPARQAFAARLKEGFQIEDFERVFTYKTEEWGESDQMAGNLNPITLTRPANFERYLQAANAWYAKGRPSLKKSASNGATTFIPYHVQNQREVVAAALAGRANIKWGAD